jgi:hypothetical protein
LFQNFDRTAFLESLDTAEIPPELKIILSAMSEDVMTATREMEEIKQYGGSSITSLLNMRNSILGRMAGILNDAKYKNALDLHSDEVKLLLRFILSTMKQTSEKFLNEQKCRKDLADALFMQLAESFQGWESKFEVFKASVVGIPDITPANK